MAKFDASDLVNNNYQVLLDFFKGMASSDYYDGTSYQLYLDLNDGEIFENHEASDNTWLERRDGSLVQILTVSGYDDTPEDDLYNDECDILDYGFAEWLSEVEDKIEKILTDIEQKEKEKGSYEEDEYDWGFDEDEFDDL